MKSNKNELKSRIYDKYISFNDSPDISNHMVNLEKRKPYLLYLIKKHFPKDKNTKILDLGCGSGDLIYFLDKKGYEYIEGVDISYQQIQLAHKLNIKNVSFGDIYGNLASKKSNSFDVVVSFDVLEHLDNDELLVLIDEVYRILKKEGRFIIHVPNADSPFFGSVRYGDITHERAFNNFSLTQLIRATGFESIVTFEDRPIIKNFKGLIRWIVWMILSSFIRLFILVETGDLRPKYISRNILSVITK